MLGQGEVLVCHPAVHTAASLQLGPGQSWRETIAFRNCFKVFFLLRRKGMS